MKKRRFLLWLLVLALVLSCTVGTAFAETEEASDPEETVEPTEAGSETTDVPPVSEATADGLDSGFTSDYKIKARAAAMYELNSQTLLYGFQMDLQLYPASLTKIMTCMLALEAGGLDETVTISDSALQNLSIYGSSAGLKAGEKLTVRELLYCIMVSSANEGCNVIAEHVAGSVEAFVEMMNQKAVSLGMTHTHFANAHGLHDDNHYTTVRDLLLMAKWAWQNPQFREFASTTKHTVPATNLSGERELETTNLLEVNSEDNKYYYDKASGIKTGFTTPAGGCLISTAKDGDMELLTVVCGCETEILDTGARNDLRFVETKKLMEYGFESFSYRQVLSDQTMLGQPVVIYAAGRKNVLVRAAENASAMLPNELDPADVTFRLDYDPPQLTAPLAEGQKVGTVTALYRGKELVTADLVTLTAVERQSDNLIVPKTEADRTDVQPAGSGLMRYWYLLFPAMILLILLIALLTMRTVNTRRAKKRAEQRRRREARRRRYDE